MTKDTFPRLVPHGSGTANVLMINNGFLTPRTKADWYDTTQADPCAPPVMCFVIEKDDKRYLWDMGMRRDWENLKPGTVSTFGGKPPTIHYALPSELPAAYLPLSGIYLSHYHWDHCGDVDTVPKDLPVYVGLGTKQALINGEFGNFGGPATPETIDRMSELPRGTLQVEGFPDLGHDVFGDGSLVIVPGPGHCPGHSVAVVRTSSSPETYMILGGDSGHHRSLYAACPCHHETSAFSTRRPIHLDLVAAKQHIERMGRAHERPDTWVIVTHEGEVIRTVPEQMWLGDWKEKGWKDKVQETYEREFKEEGCFKDSQK